MSPKLIKKLQLSVLLALCQLAPAHAYEVNAAGNIVWKYYDGKTPGGITGTTSYGPRGQILGASDGVPAYAPDFATGTLTKLTAPKTLYAALNDKINFTLKESRNINQSNIVLSGNDQTNIKIAPDKEVEVWATFYSEGAGYENSVGFFTYDPLAPPARNPNFSNNLSTEQIIFPRATAPWPMPAVPAAPAAGEGITAYLGKFKADANTAKGLALGFFVVANGWSDTGRTVNKVQVGGVKEGQDKGWIFYSMKDLNPETAVGNLNQHTILVNDSVVIGSDQRQYQRLVFGFEDVRRDLGGSDNDFNDVMMVLHVASSTVSETPATVVSNLDGLPKLAALLDPDTDKDGVNNSADEFPTDSLRAYSLWYPGSSTYGTLAFEDQWPKLGDLDMNDIVVRYRSRQILNAARAVKELQLDLRLDARGGINHSGFALALPGIKPAQIESTKLFRVDNTGLNPKGVEVPSTQKVLLTDVTNVDGDAVFEIFQDSVNEMPADGSPSCPVDSRSFRNTAPGCPIQNSVNFRLEVVLKTASSTFPLPPYDPFIFNTKTSGNTAAKAIEIHLPEKQPTSRADRTLFNTLNDASVLGSDKKYTNSYRSRENYPWALDIPIVWDYPYESLSVAKAYSQFAAWGNSKGTNNTNWYLLPVSADKTFRNGR
jgi:LruC domain-containing protein